MRDCKVFTTDGYHLDIDVQDGELFLLEQESYTDGQRASIASYIGLGTIPGLEDTGIDWKQWFTSGDTGVIKCDAAARQNIQDLVSEDYTPVFLPQEDGTLQIQVVKND